METPYADVLNQSGFALDTARNPHEHEFWKVLGSLHRGQLKIRLPSGKTHFLSERPDRIDDRAAGESLNATLHLKSYKALRRIFRTKSIGLAEGYMAGEWDSPDLGGLLELLACNMDALESRIDQWGISRAWNRVRHLLRSNTKRGSRRNISYHYDLGNDFYSQWLDPGMTYSSALFDAEHDDLAAAQQNKYRRLAIELGLKPYHRILEIGCGWAGFAEFAAENYGCHVTCLTLSREQLAYAQQRIEKAGLADRIDLRLQDYRDITGRFDRIVSIEMFEAVGEEHWPDYFKKVRDCLKSGGRAGLQIITIGDDRYEAYRDEPDFIQKYIFPGGMLPSPERLRAQISRAGLTLTGESTFGPSYARTLEIWRKDFLTNWKSIAELGYSEKFRRMWEYYLCYCEAGFRRGTIDVGHYFLRKDH